MNFNFSHNEHAQTNSSRFFSRRGLRQLFSALVLSVLCLAAAFSAGCAAPGTGGNSAENSVPSGNPGSDSANTDSGNSNSAPQTAPISISSFKLNTIVTIRIYDSTDESLLTGALAVCDKYENLLSRTIETSEIYGLNHADGRPYPISADTAALIDTGLSYCRMTDGAFDITIAPLAALWNFSSSEHIVPDTEQIEAAASLTDWKGLTLSKDVSGQNYASLEQAGAGVDLGAIAKGYVADQIKDYLLENGVASALIDLGGNMLALGSKPDGTPFRIGIQKPFEERNELCLILDIDDRSVVSSGIYERCFTDPETGIFYHHILDPNTGYPYRNSLLQVSIISSRSVDGDALSTSCFALGLEKGMELVNSLEDVHAIFITDDYAIHYSDNFPEEYNAQPVSTE